jgi:medium-chain acyl-[acyl-carrier-protein] hydrolase
LQYFHFQTRVSYTDVDDGLKLTLSGAMRMMQEAAIVHSDLIGYSVNQVEQTRVVWLLVQWHAKLVGSAHWNEPLEVLTWPRTMEKLTSDRCFRIVNRSGETVAVAESTLLLASADTGRVVRIPAEVADVYPLNPEGVFDAPTEKLHLDSGELTWSANVLRRDLDTNRHVNNLIYLEYAKEALPADLAERGWREVIVRYHRQMLLGDPIRCHYGKTEMGHGIRICGENPNHLHCAVLFAEE